MINRFLSWPIRTHLIILLLFVALPSILLIVRSGMEERKEAIDSAKKEVLTLVNTIAAEQQAVVAGRGAIRNRPCAPPRCEVPQSRSHHCPFL